MHTTYDHSDGKDETCLMFWEIIDGKHINRGHIYGDAARKVKAALDAADEVRKECEAKSDRYASALEFIGKQVERGLYCKHSGDPKLRMENIAHSPFAPWNMGFIWDVTHMEYAEKFYKDFPNARPTVEPLSGGEG